MQDMAKLTKSEVIELLGEFAKLEKRLQTLAKKRDDELSPLIEAHNEASRPILDEFEAKSTKIRAKRDEVNAQIKGYLDAAGRDQVITGEKAYAERKTETKVGPRVIDPKTFYDTVKAKGSEFWGCLSVGIAKAEKFLGKTSVDEIADIKSTEVVTTEIKLI